MHIRTILLVFVTDKLYIGLGQILHFNALLWSFPISFSFAFLKLTFNLREAEFQILKHYTFFSLKSKMITLDSVKIN